MTTSNKCMPQEYLRMCLATPFSCTFDTRVVAVVSRSCFSVSEEIFCDSLTCSVLTSLKRKIAAVVSGKVWDKSTIKPKTILI